MNLPPPAPLPSEAPNAAAAAKPLLALSWVRWLALVSALPAWLATGWILYHDYRARERALLDSTVTTARLVARNVERELGQAQAALEVLAMSPHLAAGDLTAFHRQALQVLEKQPGNGIVLAGHDGQQLMSTLVPQGQRLPKSGLPHVVRRIIETGSPVKADFYIGATSGRAQVAVGVPVVRADGAVEALTMGFIPQQLAALLVTENLPPGTISALLDANGTIVARTRAPEYAGRSASAALRAAIRDAAEGTVASRSIEGILSVFAYSRSAALGWTVAIGIPTEELNAPLREALWVSGGAIALLLLISTALPRIVTGRVAASLLKAFERVQREARHDPLTGLPNRALLSDRLEHALARSARFRREIAILAVDLDGFKAVNDSLGHAAGDAVLVEVAKRLVASLRADDSAARLGGDEFVVLLEDLAARSDATTVADKIVKALSAPILLANTQVTIGASIGIAYPDGKRSLAATLAAADKALYAAKAAGRNRYSVDAG